MRGTATIRTPVGASESRAKHKDRVWTRRTTKYERPPLVGHILGHYEILDKLGAGGMGEVYRARDTKLGREVALKLLPHDATQDPQRRQRFDKEAKAVAALQHPNIVTIHAVEEVDGVHFLTMEFVNGRTLSEHVGDERLSTDALLKLAIPLADAVGYAHGKGIIHRDLKPANIMLDREGRLKVLDFGIVKLFEPVPEADDETVLANVVTQAGTIIGTPAYMSPEQAEGKTTDVRTDVFSLGIILYELATGKAPFHGTSSMATIAAILTETPAQVTQIRRDLPNDLGRIVRKCLEKDPQCRYPSASELRDDLIRLQDAIKQSSAPVHGKIQDKTSIVVLPFANLSPDPANEYFSDGLTEEVIADLSKVGALRVISRTSAMQLKGSTKQLRTIADELDVQYALEGGVRKAGQSLRITAQLIDVGADETLWSDKYSGTLEDVFSIQETVSRAIVDSLRIALTKEEDQKLAAAPARSSFAYDVWLRARRDIWSYDRASLDRARTELEHAVELVGDDLSLYRGLAMVHWQYVNAGYTSDRKYLDRADEYARKMMELDPGGPHGPALLGHTAAHRGDVIGWVRHAQSAVAAEPNDSDFLVWLALGWGFAGFPERAAPLLDRLLSTDPLFDLLHMTRSLMEYFSGRFTQMNKTLMDARRLSPSNPGWPLLIVHSLAAAGEFEKAATTAEKLAPDPHSHPLVTLTHVLKHALRGEAEAADKLASEDFVDAIWGDGHYAHIMSQAQALLGRKEQGLRWLEQSAEGCFIHYPFLRDRAPLLDNLRAEPEFVKVMNRVREKWEKFKTELGVE